MLEAIVTLCLIAAPASCTSYSELIETEPDTPYACLRIGQSRAAEKLNNDKKLFLRSVACKRHTALTGLQ